MESTGVFPSALYDILEEAGMNPIIGNARHIKNMPGRPKTDQGDSEWIAEVCSKGLVMPSFVAPKAIRELREYTRCRDKLVSDLVRAKNRVERTLELNGFKLSCTLSDIFGASGRSVLQKLCDKGELTVLDAAGSLRRNVKKSPEEIKDSIDGVMRESSRRLLAIQLGAVDRAAAAIEAHEAAMFQMAEPYAAYISLLTTIPGMGVRAAAAILAELSDSFDKFPSASKLTFWAGLAPSPKESAGKRKSAKTQKANKFVKSVLVECAWAAVKVKGTRFSMWHRRKERKLGRKKAIIGVARKLLACIYSMVKNGEFYNHSLDEKAYEEMLDKRA
jgi:transposase